jgi:glycosyltransferase involved in cell wall biosynthesis
MKIVAAVRCYNEEKNIHRFLRGYDFCDHIVVSDGGSTDDSVSILEKNEKVKLLHFSERETVNGVTWNPDAPHMNFVIDKAKELNPDWLIFDDMDCCPNYALREQAREIFEHISGVVDQINAFRLYVWEDSYYFPHMNRDFDTNYKSLWAWRPSYLDIHADPSIHHGTLVGLTSNYCGLDIPLCLLHRSWHPDTIDKKIERQNAVGIQMEHPLNFAGIPEPLPPWAVE